jgi:DUF4097 and DUF4098 domain-containing protein YvlB
MPLSATCLAGVKINQTLSVDPIGVVFVEIPRGLVRIQGWDKSKVMIQGELDDTLNDLTFKNKKDKTLIKINSQGQNHWGDASEIIISMPRHSHLKFKGIDTSFNISLLQEHIEGKSINGDLIVNKSHGKIRLSVVSGNIQLLNSSGITKAESVSGQIDFSGKFDEAFIKSMSGDIKAEISGAKKLTINNISGDTVIYGQVLNEAQLALTSVNGDLLYKVTSELNAECEVISQFGGEITNELTHDKPVDKDLHRTILNFVSGDGSGKLTMKTITGNVKITSDTGE